MARAHLPQGWLEHRYPQVASSIDSAPEAGAPVKHARYGANTVVTRRLQRAAPFFAKILTTSSTGDERAWAAMALGGSGDRVYLPVLRRVAAEDAQARALAYDGIMYMLGSDALGDLRLVREGPLLS
jgi:hypothetical protein